MRGRLGRSAFIAWIGSLLERVGPAGAVVGVDASPEMLNVADERAFARGCRNVELLVGDEVAMGEGWDAGGSVRAGT